MTRTIVMLCYDDAQMLDIAGPLDVFALANRLLHHHRGDPEPAYHLHVVAKAGGVLRLSNGLHLLAENMAGAPLADTLLISGGIGIGQAMSDPCLRTWLQENVRHARRVAAVCTGSVLLAAAGLLERHRATTHWAYFDLLQKAEPTCLVDRTSIFVRSDKFITSAGVTSGIDMALALVEEDHGKVVALEIAQDLVVFLRRPGDQAQFSRHVQAELKDTPYAALERWVLENLDAELSIKALARRVGQSERNFYRRFSTEIGCSPASWITALRLAEARRQLEHGAPSFKEVARRCGFGNEQSLRRAFRSHLGVNPTEYAVRFG